MANGWKPEWHRNIASAAIKNGKQSHWIYQIPPKDPGTKDCSSFVCWCYGIPGRGTSSFNPSLGQYHFDYIANTRDFKQGDIVYWTKEDTGGDYGHAGIYMRDGTVMQMQGPNGRSGPQVHGPNYPQFHRVYRPPEGAGFYPVHWNGN